MFTCNKEVYSIQRLMNRYYKIAKIETCLFHMSSYASWNDNLSTYDYIRPSEVYFHTSAIVLVGWRNIDKVIFKLSD